MSSDFLPQLNKTQIGNLLETFASEKLATEGLKIILRNYSCKMGEVDLIAKDRDSLVFVEVRYRKSDSYGGSIASVTKKKQKRIILAANHYLQKHNLINKLACRFDVFAISGHLDKLNYNWIKAAFDSY